MLSKIGTFLITLFAASNFILNIELSFLLQKAGRFLTLEKGRYFVESQAYRLLSKAESTLDLDANFFSLKL